MKVIVHRSIPPGGPMLVRPPDGPPHFIPSDPEIEALFGDRDVMEFEAEYDGREWLIER